MGTGDGTVLGVTQIFGNAPRNRAFNLVLLAEGFKSDQQTAFDAASADFVASLTSTDPFDALAAAINVFRINVTSRDAGADDPVTGDGGTGATARTFFDASFGANGVRRLLVCNTTTALTTATSLLPEFTSTLVVVNSTIYGGSGGQVPTYSLAPGATEIALHEMGHSVFRLADEYAYYRGGDEPDRMFHPSTEPTEANVTTKTDPAGLKWKALLTPSVPIPTMSNRNCAEVDNRPSTAPPGTVGLFEGAHYYHCRAYRPEFDCKMRSLGAAFCRVCRQAIAARLTPLIPT